MSGLHEVGEWPDADRLMYVDGFPDMNRSVDVIRYVI